MRLILLFILLFSLSFSDYSEPPFIPVETNNNALVNSFSGSYLSGNKANLELFGQAVASVDSKAISVHPSIDERIYAGSENKLMWIWGEGHSNSLTPNDYDGDGCDESATFDEVSVNRWVDLSFRNQTIRNSQAPLTFSIPSELNLEATEGDVLFVNTTVFAYYNFTVLDKNPLTQGNSTICDGNPKKQEFAVATTRGANYSVEGGSALFFLAAPLLHEQWYRSNHFDNLLFSKRKIFDAEIYLNNQSIGYSEVYRFGVHTDLLGFQHIYSIQNLSGMNLEYSQMNESYSPKQLQNKSEFFSYVYKFNSTYSGIGENELVLTVRDHFGNNFTTRQLIYSRFLAAGNITEGNETPLDQSKFRKSSGFTYDPSPQIILAGGILLLGLIFLSGYRTTSK